VPIPRGISAACLIALLAGCAAVAPQPDNVVLPYVKSFSENPPGDHLPQGWERWVLSKLKKPTQYQLVDYDGKTVIKANAEGAASGLVHRLQLDTEKYPLLHWRWKVTGLIPSADNTRRHSEDSPVRVVVSFDGNIDSLPLDDRVFFDNVRLFSGQQLPYAMLMYIWENRTPKERVIPNPHTSRIKMIVVESGHDKVGSWQEVTRNVVEDFKRAFGEAPGKITAVGIMTDTDNTGENAHAYYGDIRFHRIVPPRAVLAHD
jgi:hypothetical protein